VSFSWRAAVSRRRLHSFIMVPILTIQVMTEPAQAGSVISLPPTMLMVEDVDNLVAVEAVVMAVVDSAVAVVAVVAVVELTFSMVLMSPTPLILSLVLNGMLYVPVEASSLSISSVNTWQAVVDVADEEEEMDVEHQVDMQLELFNSNKATEMLPLSREMESMDISIVLDLAEAQTKDAAVDMAVVLRLSRVDSQATGRADHCYFNSAGAAHPTQKARG
jgi:hypothetical protein